MNETFDDGQVELILRYASDGPQIIAVGANGGAEFRISSSEVAWVIADRIRAIALRMESESTRAKG